MHYFFRFGSFVKDIQWDDSYNKHPFSLSCRSHLHGHSCDID